MANQRLPQFYRKSFQDFSGGLNDFNSPLQLKSNEFAQLTNARINERGLLEKHKGYATDGSPFPDDVDSFIRMLVNYKRGTATDLLVVAALDEGNTNATYKVDLKKTSGDGTYTYIGHTTGTADFTNGNTAVTGTGTAWSSHLKAGDKIKATSHSDTVYAEIQTVNSDTSITLTANYTGATVSGVAYIARIILDKDYIPQSAVFNNNLIITNGIDPVLTYNNTTLNKLTDADVPDGKFIEPHKNRLFIAGTQSGQSSVYWSAVNDETSWDAAAFEPVFPNDNGNICAIKSFSDSLLVFKDNGNIYQVVGSFDQDAVGEPDFIRKIDTPSTIGTIAGYSVAVHDDNKIYFLSETGVYSIDSRLFIKKESWNVDTFTSGITLRSGTVSSKSYIYDTAAQFEAGTLSGCLVRSGKLKPYFDKLTITDAEQNHCLHSIVMDSSYNVHVAYVSSTDGKTVKYKKWLATDNTVSVDQTVSTEASSVVVGLSIALDSSNNPGIAWKTSEHLRYCKQSGGTWGSVENPTHGGSSTLPVDGATGARGISLRFRSDDLPRIVTPWANGGSWDLIYLKRDGSGTWTYVYYGTAGKFISCSLTLESDSDPMIAVTQHTLQGSADNAQQLIRILEGSGGGESALAGLESTGSVAFSTNSSYGVQLDKTSGGTFYYSYLDGSTLVRKQVGGSSSNISGTTTFFKGYDISAADLHNYYRAQTASGSQVEDFVFNATEIENSSAEISNYCPGDRSFHSVGIVYASASFGANADELIIRRVAPIATWTSQERSDTTLSVWGTYDVSGQSSNGNTILHEVALASSSPVSSYTTITNGSTVSTDGTMIYNRARITFTLAAFAESEVDSVILNYTGTGVNGFIPAGIIYENEYYLSSGTSTDSANARVLLMDTERAFSVVEYPVTFFARYRGSLYAGGASTGKVFKLIQDYRFGSSAYTLTAITKEDLLGSLELEKEVYKVYVIYEIKPSGTFDFSYRTNNFATSGGSSWTTTSVDQTVDGIMEIPITSGLLRSIQFKIESDDLDAQLGIIGLVLLYGYVNLR